MEKLEPLFIKLARIVNNWETVLVMKDKKMVPFKNVSDAEKATYLQAWLAPYVEEPTSAPAL